MKITHVIDSAGLYGAERVLLELALQQMRSGSEVQLLSLRLAHERSRPLDAAAHEIGLPVLVGNVRRGLDVFGARKLLDELTAQGVQVLHTHGYKPNILFSLVTPRTHPMLLVSTLHGWTGKGLGRMRLYEMLDRWCLKRFDAVCAVAEIKDLGDGLRSRYRDRFHIVENGIPVIEKVMTAAEARACASVEEHVRLLRANGAVICAVGRLSSEKGFGLLLHALAHLNNSGRSTHLVLIGDGPERRTLEQLALELDIADKVWFAGYVECVARCLTFFDLLVMPSFREGLPITLLEAMRAGCPIVATAVGGVPDALAGGNAGVLVAPGSVAQLAEAITLLLDNESLRSELTKRAQRRFLDYYTSEAMGQRYARVYGEVAEA